MPEQKQINFEELVQKISDLKKQNRADLSSDEDLAIAVMNLLSLEEHFYFSGVKTGKDKYFDSLNEVREIRKILLAKLIPKNEGESWCASKHLLAATMRLIEVGTKLQASGQKKEALQMFERAHNLFSIFWGLRLKLIDLPEIKKVADSEKPWTLKEITDRLVDCCEE